MANQLYGLGRQKFLEGSIDWINDDIRVILVDLADYTLAIDADEFLSDLPAAARVATSGSMTSKTSALGTADAADVTLPTVSGDTSEALVIYKHTGVESTSPLIAFLDTLTGLPITPNGADINIVWDAAGIFTL